MLLLGFAVLASTRLRRDHEAVRRRLTWFGARRGQVLVVAAAEIGGITLVASIAGWALGSGAGALLARHLGAPGGPAVEHSVFTARALGIAVALAVLTALVMLAAVRVEVGRKPAANAPQFTATRCCYSGSPSLPCAARFPAAVGGPFSSHSKPTPSTNPTNGPAK